MRAIAEITGAVLRIHEDDGAEFGEPFEWSCFVVGHEGTAILKGAKSAPKPAIAIAIRKELRRLGFKAVTWTRYDSTGGRLLPDFHASLNPKETENGNAHTHAQGHDALREQAHA